MRLTSMDGASIPAARLRLENALTGFRGELLASGDGGYSLSQLPLQAYRLRVEAEGFDGRTVNVSLRTNVPLTLDIKLQVMSVRQEVAVSAIESSTLVDPEATGTRAALSAAGLEAIPVAPGNRGLEAYLLSFPGFAVNANGAIHPRGAHNQMTYVIDGLPINDQLTGAFATALDPHIVDSLELYTGDVPAEFGSKVSGVAAVATRSGVGTGRRLFGSTEVGAGQFGTLQNITQAGGEAGLLAYFGSFSAVKTNRYLDAVSLDNLHNGGDSERAFLRLDYQLSARDWLRFNLMAGRSGFQLANLRSQHAVEMDQRQLLRDASFWLRWNRILSPAATWESTLAYRPSIAQLFPSAHDTPVTGAQARHLNTITSANRLNWLRGRHNLRGGIDVQHFLVSEKRRTW
ncbi:MAG: carboxypeptidase-like regulatory domain-containing protein [Acidobacteria bacterium]|nr:carboxypeptidase-like regulatory domain-containing protein [Acidobacteriota bacterium]